MDESGLKGIVIVVTGAGGRLGRRVVERFARQGATIAAVVRNESQAREIPFPPNGEGWAFPADVTSEKAVQTTFAQIAEHFGRMDVLIHTVGGWESKPFGDTALEDWDRVVTLNLKSAFLCFREAVRSMQGRGGRLIGISSGQGADGGRAGQAAYAAAKAGVIRLVESIADENREAGICAYAVAPSTILYDGEQGEAGVSADDLISLCEYLCTPAADAMSGSTLRIYG